MDNPLALPSDPPAPVPKVSKPASLRLWCVVSIAAGSIALIVLLISAGTFASVLSSRSHSINDLTSSLDRTRNLTAGLNPPVRKLSDSLLFQACINRRSVKMERTYITKMAKIKNAGYVISTWDQPSHNTSVHFISDDLGTIKECHVHDKDEAKLLYLQRVFPSSNADRVVLYSPPNLFLVRREDCSVRKVTFAYPNETVGAVIETGVEGEYLVAYRAKAKAVRIGLVTSEKGLVWSKEISKEESAINFGNAQLLKLKDGRYALSYLQSLSDLWNPRGDHNISAAIRAKLLASVANDTASKSSCVAIITLGANHLDAKIVHKCTGQPIFAYGLVETDRKTMVGLGLAITEIQTLGLYVVEIANDLTSFSTLLLVNNAISPAPGFGDALRISSTKYVFAARLSGVVDMFSVYAYVYDYETNNITKQVALPNPESTDCFYLLDSELVFFPHGGAVFTLNTCAGFAVVPVNGDTMFTNLKENFKHMLPSKDGGYIVHTHEGRERNKIRKFYPWQDAHLGEDEYKELNCTGVL